MLSVKCQLGVRAIKCPKCGGTMILKDFFGAFPLADKPSAYYSCMDCGCIIDVDEDGEEV